MKTPTHTPDLNKAFLPLELAQWSQSFPPHGNPKTDGWDSLSGSRSSAEPRGVSIINAVEALSSTVTTAKDGTYFLSLSSLPRTQQLLPTILNQFPQERVYKVSSKNVPIFYHS